MTKWEYITLVVDNDTHDVYGRETDEFDNCDHVTLLNVAGRKGWELTAVVFIPTERGNGYTDFFFKRPLQDSEK